MDEFILRALLAGTGVALTAGPIGCVVVWRKMAYFGATVAHAALLGLALGILINIDVRLGILFVSITVSILLVLLQKTKHLSVDTLLGIMAHGALALGLVVIALLDNVRVDLLSYLFGDILSVSWRDIIWVYLGGVVSLLALACIWRSLLSTIVHEDLARVEGVWVDQVRLVFLVLLSIVIAVAMQMVGVLLIVSMLIIPPAVARRFCASPETMAIAASIVGTISVAAGLAASLTWDTPAGPSIVVATTIMFLASLAFPSTTVDA